MPVANLPERKAQAMRQDQLSKSELKVLLGAAIRAAREERGWSQEDLASTARVPKSSLSQIETGLVEPGAFGLARLLGALGQGVETVLPEYYTAFKERGEGVFRLYDPERAGKVLGQRTSPAGALAEAEESQRPASSRSRSSSRVAAAAVDPADSLSAVGAGKGRRRKAADKRSSSGRFVTSGVDLQQRFTAAREEVANAQMQEPAAA